MIEPCCGKKLQKIFSKQKWRVLLVPIFKTDHRYCYFSYNCKKLQLKWREILVFLMVLLVPMVLFSMIGGKENEIYVYALGSTVGSYFVLQNVIHDKDATHNYNETNKILAGPLISLVALFLFHCSGYYNAFGQAIGEKNTTLHNTSMNKMNNIKSMRIILMFSSCCICYVQSSSLLKVLHGTYQYFERLTKLVELFTLSSKHPSWYSFFRRFARYDKKNMFFFSSKKVKKRDLSFFFFIF